MLRLIDSLCDAGANAISPPALPALRSSHPPAQAESTGSGCAATAPPSPAPQPCARCGAVREAATRDEHGRPLCAHCLITDPANHETCVQCGRRRPVSVRTPDGPLCGKLPSLQHRLTCAICGRTAPCVISKATGQPWCCACKQRWIRCAGCGQVAPLRGGTLDEPLCATCTRPDTASGAAARAAANPDGSTTGRCARCSVTQRLRELLADDTGTIPTDRQALYQALAATERPSHA